MRSTIYYHREEKRWFHSDRGSSYTFGKNETLLPFAEAKPSCLSFAVAKKGKKLGPLIGILISESTLKKLLNGRKKKLESIHHILQLYGGICIAFSTNDLQAKKVHGYVFSDEQKQWLQVTAPLPDVVYNRIKNRREEQAAETQRLLQTLHEKQIPYFNPSFFTKWELYNMLKTNELLRPHLPATVRVSSPNDVINMLETYKHIYMKPNEGYKGKGIFTLQLNKKGNDIIFSNRKQQKTLSHLTPLFHVYNLDEYIAQEAISPDTLNGKRYDLRVLAHYQNGSYNISGIGVRQSVSQQVTTHIPNGGRLISYEFVKEKIDEPLLQQIVAECGKTLSEHIGFVGEFSLDIGRTPDGHLYIYELNSKPMIFDEPHIEEKGTKNLIRVFHEVSGFVEQEHLQAYQEAFSHNLRIDAARKS
jgi:hypothetical protein